MPKFTESMKTESVDFLSEKLYLYRRNGTQIGTGKFRAYAFCCIDSKYKLCSIRTTEKAIVHWKYFGKLVCKREIPKSKKQAEIDLWKKGIRGLK